MKMVITVVPGIIHPPFLTCGCTVCGDTATRTIFWKREPQLGSVRQVLGYLCSGCEIEMGDNSLLKPERYRRVIQVENTGCGKATEGS